MSMLLSGQVAIAVSKRPRSQRHRMCLGPTTELVDSGRSESHAGYVRRESRGAGTRADNQSLLDAVAPKIEACFR